MTNVISINGEPPKELGEVRSELVATLENLLDRAKTGQLQSFIGTGFCSDGARLAIWVDLHTNVYEMLGSIGWLQHEYVQRHTEVGQ